MINKTFLEFCTFYGLVKNTVHTPFSHALAERTLWMCIRTAEDIRNTSLFTLYVLVCLEST